MLALIVYVGSAAVILIWGTIYMAIFTGPISVGFVTAGIISISDFDKGRRIAFWSLVATGVLAILSIRYIVPAANSGPIGAWLQIVIVLFSVVVVFACFIPSRTHYSTALFIFCLGIPTMIAVGDLVFRWQDGEYSRPAVASFKWIPGTESLTVKKDENEIISPQVYDLLKASEITGELVWSSGADSRQTENLMIIIASHPPQEPAQLHYSSNKIIIYLYDGAAWKTIPSDAKLYESAATISRLRHQTLIFRPHPIGGGVGGSLFVWKQKTSILDKAETT